MPRFRKKPVEISAVQYIVGAAANERWLIDAFREGVITQGPGQTYQIKTAEGVMDANPGDWIIQGVKGELYPCKADIFDLTYEAAD